MSAFDGMLAVLAKELRAAAAFLTSGRAHLLEHGPLGWGEHILVVVVAWGDPLHLVEGVRKGALFPPVCTSKRKVRSDAKTSKGGGSNGLAVTVRACLPQHALAFSMLYVTTMAAQPR
eukprot:SAG31_NODE_4494_length_3187_cov_13.919365_2_plen_118_part_00